MHPTRIGRPDDPPLVETQVGREQSASEAVTEVVAVATNTSPTDLPPLYDSIDPDALNDVVRSLGDEGRVVFPYFGCTVAVNGDGNLEVYDGE